MSRISLFLICLLLACLTTACGGKAKRQQLAEVHYTLGLSYLREPNPSLALKEFLRATELDSENPAIHDGLGQAYMLKKAFPESEKHFLQAIKISRGEPRYQNNLAALYLEMGRYDDAILYFGKSGNNLLFTSPDLSFVGVGYAHFQKGNYLEAAAAYKKALGHNPQSARARMRLGEAYYALDKTEMAVTELLEALRLAPSYAEAHYKLALAYVKLRKIGQAKASFTEVVGLAPDSELARLSRDYLKILK